MNGIFITEKLASYLRNIKNNSEELYRDYGVKVFQDFSTYKKLLNSYKGIRRAQIAHQLADQLIQKDLNSRTENIPICKKGCSHCCYVQLNVAYNEALLIEKHIKDNDIVVDFCALKKQAQFGEGQHFKFIQDLPLHDRKCVFLKDDCCSIYPVRPIRCRTHLAIGNAEDCSTANGGKITAFTVIPDAEILESSLIDISVCASLPEFLVSLLDCGH